MSQAEKAQGRAQSHTQVTSPEPCGLLQPCEMGRWIDIIDINIDIPIAGSTFNWGSILKGICLLL